MSEKIKKYLKNSIDEKGNYCYSLPVETTKAVIKELDRLNNIINECSDDILKELKENHHLSYEVALSIRNKLLDYKELKDSDKNEKMDINRLINECIIN